MSKSTVRQQSIKYNLGQFRASANNWSPSQKNWWAPAQGVHLLLPRQHTTNSIIWPLGFPLSGVLLQTFTSGHQPQASFSRFSPQGSSSRASISSVLEQIIDVAVPLRTRPHHATAPVRLVQSRKSFFALFRTQLWRWILAAGGEDYTLYHGILLSLGRSSFDIASYGFSSQSKALFHNPTQRGNLCARLD